KDLSLLDEAALGEWPFGDDAFDARPYLDAPVGRDLADELVRFGNARRRNGDDADLGGGWDEWSRGFTATGHSVDNEGDKRGAPRTVAGHAQQRGGGDLGVP